MKPVNPLTIQTDNDLEVVIIREFDAPRELLYRCHTEAELVRQWLLGPPGWTMPVCEIDARVGGKYRYVWKKDSGTEMGMGGLFREIVRPERIVNTQLFDQDWTGGETIGTMTLTESNGLARAATGTRDFTEALNSLAPSKWVRSPRARAKATAASTYAGGNILPPKVFSSVKSCVRAK